MDSLACKLISENKIFNEVESQKILIFDFRSKEQFHRGCIRNFSINLPSETLGEKFFENPKILENRILESFASTDFLSKCIPKLKRFFVIIIMSEEKLNREEVLKYAGSNFNEMKGLDENIINTLIKPIKFYRNLVNNKVRELGLFYRGFSTFERKFPFIVSNKGEPCKLL